MNKNIYKVFLTLFILIFFEKSGLVKFAQAQPQLIQLSPSQTQTAENVDLTVTPPTVYLKVKPGSKITHTITLSNDSPQDLSITPTLVDFKADGRSGRPVLESGHSFPYIEDELEVFSPITLPKDKTAQLTLRISVPADAEQKEYPLTVLFQSQPIVDNLNSTQLTGTVGSNMIILVSPDNTLPLSLKVNDIEMLNLRDSFQSLEFTPIAANDGLGAQQASGSATITDWRGRVVSKFTIYPDVILGGTNRTLRAAAPDLSSADQPTNQLKIKPDLFKYDPTFLLGPYKITINLTELKQDDSTDQEDTLTASSTYSEVFFAFPFGALAIIILLAGSVLFSRSSRKTNQRKLEDQAI